MYKLTKASVAKSYNQLINRVENPRFIDGVFSRKQSNWDIMYKGKDFSGIIAKNGNKTNIRMNHHLKFNVSKDGKIRQASLRTLLSGKRGLEKANTMLNNIIDTLDNPTLANRENHRIKIEFNMQNMQENFKKAFQRAFPELMK